MDVLEAIRTRRTPKQYRPDPVPHVLIQQVVEAAVWAPNHRLTEPWEFVVVQGETLDQLGQVRRQMALEYLRRRPVKPETPPPTVAQLEHEGEAQYRKAVAAPVTIVVSMTLHQNPTIREEDYAATAAAIQNLALAAHGLGLAAFWSTNHLIDYPPTFALLGIPTDRRIVGIVQLGYPVQLRDQRRTAAAFRTRWLQ